MRIRVSANLVTILRVLLLPIPCILLYENKEYLWIYSFIFFFILGITDFIDGWLARLNGPTRLGGILDQVSDKIYIAVIFLLLSYIGMFGYWISLFIISREVILNMFRISLKESKKEVNNLGKIKTILQMGGIILLCTLLCFNLLYIIRIFQCIFILLCIFRYFIKPNFWISTVLFSIFLLLILSFYFSISILVYVILIFILYYTLFSGVVYIKLSYMNLNKKKRQVIYLLWYINIIFLIFLLIFINQEDLYLILVNLSLNISFSGFIMLKDKKTIHMKLFEYNLCLWIFLLLLYCNIISIYVYFFFTIIFTFILFIYLLKLTVLPKRENHE